jgi:hypothetical protein
MSAAHPDQSRKTPDRPIAPNTERMALLAAFFWEKLQDSGPGRKVGCAASPKPTAAIGSIPK